MVFKVQVTKMFTNDSPSYLDNMWMSELLSMKLNMQIVTKLDDNYTCYS